MLGKLKLIQLNWRKPSWKVMLLALVVALGALAGVGLIARHQTKGITKIGITKTDEPKVAESVPQPLPIFEDYGLKVDKLRISAPIIPNVDGFNEKIYYAALTKGVAQFKGSVNPDQSGNLFIFGHSSFWENTNGKYKEVFKELNKLATGDDIMVYHKKTSYRYRVLKSYLTDDKDWSLLNPLPKDPKAKTLTLMTCWPPGTIDKRWVVTAQQI